MQLVPQENTNTEYPCEVWALPHHAQAVPTSRRITARALTVWGIADDTAHQAVLVVSELVANAVAHALPPIALHLNPPSARGVIHVEVDDGGPASVEATKIAAGTEDEHGRGYLIIDALTRDHGCRPYVDHTSNWAEIETSCTSLCTVREAG
ncbi:ATP-binding protein [Streptomyces sp. RKAG290]|uniref:ATP-binding protein n=1 Tax=Streptomyces sp. RKAG290 TaxID=2888348 RepID=UPI0020334864|nr:ATP-binding protein [Streptomyces sp. RKAG290]MCM2410816.1 ATP-binding protein [Streptomyces sp. RKAG290]